MTEAKVGVLVFVTIVAVFFTSLAIKKVHFFGASKGIAVSFYVENALGLAKDAQVKYMGIDVGTVTDISLQGQNIIIVAVISSDFNIPDNVAASVSQDGLIGEKYLNLTLMGDIPSDTYLKDKVLYTNYRKQPSFDDIARKVDEIADNLKQFTGAINNTLEAEKGGIAEIVENLRISTALIREILEDNKKQIDSIVTNIKDLSDALGKATKGKEREFSDIIENLNQTMASLKDFSSDLALLMQGQKDNISASLEGFKGTMQNLSEITKDAHEGRGTLGMLLTDNETRDSLKKTLAALNEMTSAAGRFAFELEAGVDYIEKYDDYKGRFDVKIHPNYPNGGRYYLLGVSNNPIGTTKHTKTTTYIDDKYIGTPYRRYEDEEKVTVDPLVFSLQYAMIFRNMFTARAGVFDSRLGFAFDYKPFEHRRLYFTAEASDFFRKEYGTFVKTGAKYYFLENFFLQTSWDDLASSRSSFAFGGGITFFDNDLKYIISSVPMPK